MRTDLYGRFRAWLTASLGAWAIWTSTVWAIGYLPPQLSTFWQSINDAVTRAILFAAVACVLLLGFLWCLPKYLSMLRRWGHRQECLAVDFGVFTFGVFAGLTWWFGLLNSWKSNVFGVVCLAALGTLFARIVVAKKLRAFPAEIGDVATKSVDFFDTVLGRIGLAPLIDFSAEDKLGREALPHEDAAIRLLSEALDPLLQIVGEDTARTFVERLKGHPRAIYIDTLPTPREIRRVTAATASVWPRMSRHLDLFDLFILSIIQYLPKTYATLHAHPEWFSQMKWSSNAWRLTEEKRWEAERQSFFDNLKADKSRDADFQLVSSLQINIRDQGNH